MTIDITKEHNNTKETNIIKRLKEYKNKLYQYHKLEEDLITKSDFIKKNLMAIQKEFKDEISAISNSDTNFGSHYFCLSKVKDEDIGFCGTLEFEIYQHQLRIDRIGFMNQVTISFYKNEIKVFDENYTSNKAYKQLDTKQFIEVYKTINYFLLHKDEIKKLIDDYLLNCLEKDNRSISEKIAWINSIS